MRRRKRKKRPPHRPAAAPLPPPPPLHLRCWTILHPPRGKLLLRLRRCRLTKISLLSTRHRPNSSNNSSSSSNNSSSSSNNSSSSSSRGQFNSSQGLVVPDTLIRPILIFQCRDPHRRSSLRHRWTDLLCLNNLWWRMMVVAAAAAAVETSQVNRNHPPTTERKTKQLKTNRVN